MRKILFYLFLFTASLSHAQNVGIGTTTPGAMLDVKSPAGFVSKFNGGINTYIGIYENDLYRGYLGSFAGAAEDVDFGTGFGNLTGKLHLTIGAVPKFTINSSGLVGIGTTIPSHLLHINGGDLFVQSSAGSIKLGYEGSNEWGLGTVNGGADIRWFNSTDGDATRSYRHFFRQNGNVGFGNFTGSATPAARLDVLGEGNSAATNTLLIRNSNSDSLFKVRDDGTVFVGNPTVSDVFNYSFRVEEKNSRGALFVENPITAGNATVRILRGISPNTSYYTAALNVEASLDPAAYFKGLGGIDATATSALYAAGNFTAAPLGNAINANGKLRFFNNGEGPGKVLTSDVDGNASWQSLSGTHSHFGELWTGTATAGLSIYNSSAAATSVGITGLANGGGSNLTLGISGYSNSLIGIGVAGVNYSGTYAPNITNAGISGAAGTGYGVGGTSLSGYCFYGLKQNSASYTNSVARFENQSTTNTDPVVQVVGNGTQPSIELNNGFIKVSGTNKTVFVHVASAANISGHITTITYPNPASSDLLIVTPNWTAGPVYNPHVTGVYFTAGKWTIFNQDFAVMPVGVAFNVLVIKQ